MSNANLVLEPSPKDSAAAIGLAAMLLQDRNPDVIIGSFAADHVIRDAELFSQCVTLAIDAAELDYIATIGIWPTYPSTGFGYIHAGERLVEVSSGSVFHVREFVEKPEYEVAEQYVQSGKYRWNAGMFVSRASEILSHLKASEPELYLGLRKISDSWNTPNQVNILADVWPSLPKIAIDYAIAEPAARAGKVVMVPGAFGWDDIGDFDAVTRLSSAFEGDDAVTVVDPASRVVSKDSSGLVLSTTGRVVALLGVEDIVVVDTGDALLITRREHAQSVKSTVDSLKSSGLHDVL